MATGVVATSSEVIRTLAHELRQPLGTIESIAYYLRLILPEDEKIHLQLERIQNLVEQSNWMLTSSEFLADPLPLSREILDLRLLAMGIDLAGFDVRIEENIPTVLADAFLIRAMLRNLIALLRQFPGTASFTLAAVSGGALIELATTATGHRNETSFGPGGGLSLCGARRVIEAHEGSLDLDIDPVRGIRLRVMLT